MVGNKIRKSLKRVDFAEKKVIKRRYNRTYYQATKEHRREQYRNIKQNFESNFDCVTLSSTPEHAATTTTSSNSYKNIFGTINDYREKDRELNDLIEYNNENNQDIKTNIDESSHFFDMDRFSVDEEHSGETLDEELNKLKVNLSSREYCKTDIATCLCLLKKRHKCSNALLSDLISLLYIIIPDAQEKIPKSLFEIRKLLKITENKNQSTLSEASPSSSSTIAICQSCEMIVKSTNNCSNIQCSQHIGFTLKPYTYTYFNIRRQIEQILQRETKIRFQKASSSSIPEPPPTAPIAAAPLPTALPLSLVLTDIKDARIYRDFLSKVAINDCHYITLTLSTDGVQTGTSTEKSLWLITLTINEIEKSDRFLLHNVIVGGINNCFKKPSRQIMRIMIDPIVHELKELENPKFCYIKSLNNKFEMYCVHLLGSTNDKPATALLQNIPEPNAAFGCSRCEIKGITTLSNPLISEKKSLVSAAGSNKKKTFKETHRIRVFVMEKDQAAPALRSTERYQTIMNLIERHQPAPGTLEEQDMQRGYLGPCLLTDLTFFDHGHGFMSDSLHTIYGGAMKKLLCLWFDRKWCTKEKPWTVESKIPDINRILNSFYSPSTTVRIPRNLKIYNKYKASEYRSMLLIFYPIFQDILPKEYYDHLKLLVFALHVGEGRAIKITDLETMHLLLNEHVERFKSLYGERHCVNTIHSITHFADTVYDYGPLQCYSTFHYESILGSITSTLNGCQKHDKEMFNNMEMLRQSSYMALVECQESPLYEYMLHLLRRGRRASYSVGEFRTTKPIQLKSSERNQLKQLYSTENIQAYYRCEYEKIQYSSYHWHQSRSDAAILFRKDNIEKLQFAIINRFIVREQPQKQLFIEIFELENEYCDFVVLNDVTVENSNTSIGQLNFTSTKRILPTQIVEKVFCLHKEKQFMFIRLPNESESS